MSKEVSKAMRDDGLHLLSIEILYSNSVRRSLDLDGNEDWNY